ncbi:hypothetical protein ACFL2H_11185 [Planctomycetota bacterium]
MTIRRSTGTFLVSECLERREMLSASPHLISDWGQSPASVPHWIDRSEPNVAQVRGDTLFVAGTQDTGLELWKTAVDGPTLLADLNPGIASGVTARTKVVPSPDRQIAYFIGQNDRFHGLFRTDGSSVAMVYPNAIYLLDVNDDGAHFVSGGHQGGYELWFAAHSGGAQYLTRFDTLGEGPFRNAVSIGNEFFFNACSLWSGGDCELWRSDNTFEGTHPVESIPISDRGNHVAEVDGELIAVESRAVMSEHRYKQVTTIRSFDGVQLATFDGKFLGQIEERLFFSELENLIVIDGSDFKPISVSPMRGLNYQFGESVAYAVDAGQRLFITDGTPDGTRAVFESDDGSIELLGVTGTEATFYIADANLIGITNGTPDSTRTNTIAAEAMGLFAELHQRDDIGYADGTALWFDYERGLGEFVWTLDNETLEFSRYSDRWDGTWGSLPTEVGRLNDGRALLTLQNGDSSAIVATDGDSIEVLHEFNGGIASGIEQVFLVGESTFAIDRSGRLFLINPEDQSLVILGDEVASLSDVRVQAATVRDGKLLLVGWRNRNTGIWETDGTQNGTTRRLYESRHMAAKASPDGRLFIHGLGHDDSLFPGIQWYETDGTENGTFQVTDEEANFETRFEFPSIVLEERQILNLRRWVAIDKRTGRETILDVSEIKNPIQFGNSVFFQARADRGSNDSFVYRFRSRNAKVEKYSELPVRELLGITNGNLIVSHYEDVYDAEPWSIPLRVDGDFGGDHPRDDLDRFCRAYSAESSDPVLDVNFDSLVNEKDLDAMVRDWAATNYGDANLDGRFDSSDLVQIFQGGAYETDKSASWNSGDWNCDGRFDSSDLVKAFLAGGYSIDSKSNDRTA